MTVTYFQEVSRRRRCIIFVIKWRRERDGPGSSGQPGDVFLKVTADRSWTRSISKSGWSNDMIELVGALWRSLLRFGTVGTSNLSIQFPAVDFVEISSTKSTAESGTGCFDVLSVPKRCRGGHNRPTTQILTIAQIGFEIDRVQNNRLVRLGGYRIPSSPSMVAHRATWEIDWLVRWIIWSLRSTRFSLVCVRCRGPLFN